ncbi:ABC transporter permease [Roseivivax sp. GX 12232]|uniref:ABC transporter permease n=1 Tax=Roseivivax sp. GX 12232 TaxID=2900547 RepID=UPI001E481001|nr:ABC transporter permease [Roseivivax sp. GX 12232]MCE0503967.1 ABC transporter permease [Roseivivax sp. GX 12232]
MSPGRTGYLFALPVALFLLAGFATPIGIVAWYSLMEPRTFALTAETTLTNYRAAFTEGYGPPFFWSITGAVATTLACALLAWPTAKMLHQLAGRGAAVLTGLIAVPIFVSESVRLFGMSLFLMPGGGILAGSLRALFDVNIGTVLNTKLGVFLGMVYVHFPFMLFPLLLGVALIPQDRRDAARDLGASRWQILREVELPLAMPGLIIGALLTFVLCVGANAEAAILGGQAISVVTRAIEQRFSYAQDWPMGAALTMLVVAVTALVVFPALARIDLNKLIRR